MPAIQTTAPKRSVRSRQPLKRATNVTLSADVLDAAKALEDLRREYARKCSTLRRSPLDESVWVRKFAELDADYAKLVKEYQALRVENQALHEYIQKLILHP